MSEEDEYNKHFREIASKANQSEEFRQHLNQVVIALGNLFNYLDSTSGQGEVDGVKVQAFCPMGHVHDMYLVERLPFKENENDGPGTSGPASGAGRFDPRLN